MVDERSLSEIWEDIPDGKKLDLVIHEIEVIKSAHRESVANAETRFSKNEKRDAWMITTLISFLIAVILGMLTLLLQR